ncbi:Dynein light chain [Giardia duodenalis]|uniref:Dynein light chain n=2 Tax=Giardia intestinalis TaxID=5741 RepID=C6LMX4_GIAIB|nr:Dynein light chain [Giardia intestinalis ATCC 50581]ESU43268.1 Dynein light chain [Giardia intestinalis]
MAEISFVSEEVNGIVKDILDTMLGQVTYQQNKMTQLTESVIDEVLKRLVALKKPYKYLVSCVLMQKMGAGLHSSAAEMWDITTDGYAHVRWDNKTMFCFLTVFGVSI